MGNNDIELVFYGVRGSRPVADKNVVKYGGNTASILIEKEDKIIILDAGTGIINIGYYLKEKKAGIKDIHIFLTHFHFDHILGLPFFEPFFSKEYTINIYAASYDQNPAKEIILRIFNQPYSPISNAGIKAKMNFIELDVNKKKTIALADGLTVEYRKDDSHPLCGVLIYKLTGAGKTIVYATDVETPAGLSKETLEFIHGADILIHDSQYFDSHYDALENPKKGFGHNSVSMAVRNALQSRVKKLFLFHYDPLYSDRELEIMLEQAREKFKNTFLSEELKKIHL